MARVTLITGGARSGKSRFAERLAKEYSPPLGYVATGTAGDGEMTERIARHRARRGEGWETLEEPLELCEVIRGHDGYFNVMLIDCVTLWLTNLLLKYGEPEPVMVEVNKLTAAFPVIRTPLIFVSNEVGMGIVPENRLARVFRDLAGEANELIAAAADEVFITFSGLPLKLK